MRAPSAPARSRVTGGVPTSRTVSSLRARCSTRLKVGTRHRTDDLRAGSPPPLLVLKILPFRSCACASHRTPLRRPVYPRRHPGEHVWLLPGQYTAPNPDFELLASIPPTPSMSRLCRTSNAGPAHSRPIQRFTRASLLRIPAVAVRQDRGRHAMVFPLRHQPLLCEGEPTTLYAALLELTKFH